MMGLEDKLGGKDRTRAIRFSLKGISTLLLAGSLVFGCAGKSRAQRNNPQVSSPLYTYVSPDNYNEEVVKASVRQPVLVLFETDYYGTRGDREGQDTVNNMREIYDALAKKYKNKIIFAKFKVQDKNTSLYILKNYNIDGLPSIGMYIGERQIDILGGGPTTRSAMVEWKEFLDKEWIPTNVIEPNCQWAWRFNNTSQERKIAYNGCR